MVICGIDAGRWGKEGDVGTSSVDGRIRECDWTIGLARMVQEAIMREPGMDCVMFRRRNDEVISVPDRASRAEEYGCNFVVSIHVDAAPTPTWHGATILYHPGSPISRVIADQIAACWPPVLRRQSEARPAGPKYQRANNVLSCYQMPAVLCECGFASNIGDVAALVEPTVHVQIVGAIMQGLRLFRQRSETNWIT